MVLASMKLVLDFSLCVDLSVRGLTVWSAGTSEIH